MDNSRFFSSRLLLALLLTAGLAAAPLRSPAQCVLCSTQVETARQEKDGYEPGGLNKGILYLMTIPYLLMGAVGYGWYRVRSDKPATPPPAGWGRHLLNLP